MTYRASGTERQTQSKRQLLVGGRVPCGPNLCLSVGVRLGLGIPLRVNLRGVDQSRAHGIAVASFRFAAGASRRNPN